MSDKQHVERRAGRTSTEMARLLRPVRARSATDLVVDRMQNLILDRSFGPGAQLPSEPELSEILGVSRSTIREAKKALMERGLIELRGRHGSFVVGPPTDPTRLPSLRDLLANPELPELHESRELIEVGAIRIATTRATGQDIADLNEALDQIQRDIEHQDPAAWPRLVSFHRDLVRAAHNKVLLSVFDLLAHLIEVDQVPFYHSVSELHEEVQSHRLLVEAIAKRDPAAAAAAMHSHLEESEQLRQNALSQLND